MNPGDTETSTACERIDPLTGRSIRQLTSGDSDDYPLYYFIPTVTRDGRSLIFHRLRDGHVQYYRLDLDTGLTVCLTAARTCRAMWRPWLQPNATGVREYLGALSQQNDELVYFDENQIRAVHVFDLTDRLVTTVPQGRVPCGLTGVSPDGQHFVYPHADRDWWDANAKVGPNRAAEEPVRVELVDLAAGSSRTILCIRSWITHSHFYDNRRILMSHPPTEHGILMTDLDGDWYQCLRTPTVDGTQTCHYQATRRGVMYEFNGYAEPVNRDLGVMGICDPDTHARREYDITARITHIGLDAEGLLWFGEQIRETPRFGRTIGYCPQLKPGAVNEFVALTEPIVTCGDQRFQRAHTHPVLMPDRRHILFIGGDTRTNTNHPCLLDVSDLADVVSEAP